MNIYNLIKFMSKRRSQRIYKRETVPVQSSPTTLPDGGIVVVHKISAVDKKYCIVIFNQLLFMFRLLAADRIFRSRQSIHRPLFAHDHSPSRRVRSFIKKSYQNLPWIYFKDILCIMRLLRYH